MTKPDDEQLFDQAMEIELDTDSDVGVARNCPSSGALRPLGWLGLKVKGGGKFVVRLVVKRIAKEGST